MLNSTSRFGLVSALLVSLAPLPAQSQTLPSQGGSQGAVVIGNNNTVTQIINQTIVNQPGRGERPRWRGKDEKFKEKNEHRRRRHGHRDRDWDKD